jgi:spore photoproduct lyase
MHKAASAGYLIGVHFDPMILYTGWESGYTRLVHQVFEAVDHDGIAWISMGSLRFNPEMKKKIENNYPDSRITCAEMVLGDDMKVRYVKPLRAMMYRLLYGELMKHARKDNLIYLCMERWDVWERIFGWFPDSIGHIDYLFARSLKERFGLGAGSPDRELYEEVHKEDPSLPLPSADRCRQAGVPGFE